MKVFVLFICVLVKAVQRRECRALVMSGGGSNGAWEAGVLWGLMHYDDPRRYQYDVVSGVSIGSVNAAAIAMWPVGKEVEASEYLSDTWKNLTRTGTKDNIYEHWLESFFGGDFIGVIIGFWKKGFYNTQPGKDWLKDRFEKLSMQVNKELSYSQQLNQRGFKRMISVSAIDVETGEVVLFNEKNTKFEEFYLAVMASAAMPGVFPPIEFKGRILMDGGVAYNTNVEQAVKRCREITSDDSQITIDILITHDQYAAKKDQQASLRGTTGNTITNFFRATEIKENYSGSNSIVSNKRAHPKINWRHVITQHEDQRAEGLDLIDFEQHHTWPMQEQGRQQARQVLDAEKENIVRQAYDLYLRQSL